VPDWMQNAFVKQAWGTVAPHLPSIALALGILVGGWIAALIVRGLVFAALKRTTLDDRLADAIGVENVDERVERGVAKAVYYALMAFVLVAFLERLHVKAVTTPIVAALAELSGAVPSILKALLIGFAGYVAASVLRKLLVALLDRTGLVARVETWSDIGQAKPPKKRRKKGKREEPAPASLSETIGNVVFWLIIVLTAIPVLDALRIGVLAAPLSTALAVVSTYLPKVAGAALLGAVGYFLGRAARAVITAVIDKTGVDRVLVRFGLGGILGKQTAGSIVGNIVMAFIVLQFAISAVGRLDIKEISGPLGLTLQQIYTFLPRLLVATALLAFGVALARIVSRFSRGVLAAIGFNTLMVHIGLYEELSDEAKQQEEKNRTLLDARMETADEDEQEATVDPLVAEPDRLRTPADIAGVVVGAIIVVLFLRQALGTLGLAGKPHRIPAPSGRCRRGIGRGDVGRRLGQEAHRRHHRQERRPHGQSAALHRARGDRWYRWDGGAAADRRRQSDHRHRLQPASRGHLFGARAGLRPRRS